MNQTAPRPDRIAAELAADLDAGFAALFEAHQHVLFSTALRICGGWADAEDLTATAFLRAFRALSGYDRERIAALRTRPWLLTILLNAWRNQVRTAARQPRVVLDAELPEPVARGASVEAQAERHETSRELAALLDLLNLRLLARPAVAWELTANFARTSTYFAMLFVLAQYLQQGLGRSATYSGLVLVSWVAAFGIAAPVTRRRRPGRRRSAECSDR